MSTVKEIAIAMVKKLEEKNNELVNEIQSNNKLMNIIRNEVGITDEDVYEEDYINFYKTNPDSIHQQMNSSFIYHDETNNCDAEHFCDNCAHLNKKSNDEPCIYCCQVVGTATCFFKPVNN